VLREKYGVWSPTRDLNSVIAFKAALGLRPERWVWVDDPQVARWWVVDAKHSGIEDLSQGLRDANEGGDVVHGALLAPNWSAIKDPIWTFLKTPLQINIVFKWIDGCLLKHGRRNDRFQGRMRLTRWPNMSKYSGGNAGAGMQITLACATLLRGWANYGQLLSLTTEHEMLDAMLGDAQKNGILEFEARAGSSAGQETAPQAAEVEKPGAWNLVKRLIKKFT